WPPASSTSASCASPRSKTPWPPPASRCAARPPTARRRRRGSVGAPPARCGSARRYASGAMADPTDPTLSPESLRFDERGLIPAIVQQRDGGEVLMMAWMTAESLAETRRRGETVFWSRSRAELWHKGATSGNTQRVVDIVADCDGDVLLVKV